MIGKRIFAHVLLLSMLILPGLTAIASTGEANPEEIPIHVKTRIYIVDKDITFDVEKKWVPVRKLFGPIVEKITWDYHNKVATIEKNGKQWVFNFSGNEMDVKDNQFLVPSKYAKFQGSKTFIDARWLAFVFDAYASEGNLIRDELRSNLQFLGIKRIDWMPDFKSSVFRLPIELVH